MISVDCLESSYDQRITLSHLNYLNWRHCLKNRHNYLSYYLEYFSTSELIIFI